jgi:hypothetical protein
MTNCHDAAASQARICCKSDPHGEKSLIGFRRARQELGDVGRDPPRFVTCERRTFTAASRASFGGIKC